MTLIGKNGVVQDVAPETLTYWYNLGWGTPGDSAVPTNNPDAVAPPRSTPLELMPAFIKGDSYAKSQLSDGTDNGTRFGDRLFSRLRTQTPSNTGAGGKRSDQILAEQIAGGVWVPNTRGVVLLADVLLNDVNQGMATKDSREAFRSILSYLSARYVGALADTGVQYGPGWTSGVSDGTAGRYVDFAFTGDSIDLQLAYGSTGGTATVTRTGDGASVGSTITTSGYGRSFTGTVPLSGFGAGSHTIRLTVNTGTIAVVGYAIPSPTPPSIIWFKPAEPLAANWVGKLATPMAALAAVAATYPHVLAVEAGPGWNPATMLAADQIHPNDFGQAYIANQLEQAVRSSLTWRAGLNYLTATPTTAYPPIAPTYNNGAGTTPAAPGTPTATAASQATLAWSLGNDNGATITSQVIQASSDSGATWADVQTVGATATTVTILSGLTQGTSYVFRVIAVNTNGRGTPSAASNSVTAGAVTSVYAADSFNRADSSTTPGTSETGSKTWTVPGSGSTVFGITSNRLRCVQATDSTAPGDCYVDTGQADGTITVTNYLTNGSAGLLFRAGGTNNANGYLVFTSGGVYRVAKRTAVNTYTTLNITTQAVAAGDVVKVILSGNSIVVKVNGTTVWSGSDASYPTNTRHGVWAVTAGATFDDFSHTS